MNTTVTEGDRCKDARVRVCEGVMPLKKTLKARDEGLVSNSSALNSMRTGQSKIPLNPLLEEDEISNDKLERRKDFRNKKKKNKKNIKYPKLKIKPHSTSLYGDFIERLSGLDKNIASEALETFLTALLVKCRKSNIERALIISAKLIKTHLGASFSDIISKVLLCKDIIFVKSVLSWSLEDLELYMKDLLDNWKVANKNEAFSSIVILVSTFLAIFYSADKKWSLSIGSFSLFLFDAKHACKGATSLVDAMLKVSTFVIGGLKKYIDTGSLSGFLYSDDQLGELDATVSNLQSQFKYVKPGNLGRFTGLDENSFDQQLQQAISSGEKLVMLYDGPTKKFVMDKVRMLKQLHSDFIQTRAAGGLRVAPFAYLLAGSTGLGKSSINEILMRYTLSINGYNHQDPYIVTLNSQDKFYSTYRSYINGVIFDDFANVKSDFVEESPCDVLLKFVNNVPYYLNMAEIELKGNVVAEPKIVGITTNVNDIDSSVYSNQASSIMRRMKVHIYARVKPEFQKEGTIEIDPSLVQAAFGDNALAPDIWLFDVYVVKVRAIDRQPKMDFNDSTMHRDDPWYLQYVQWNGSDMRGATIKELLLYMKQATTLHFREQNELVERCKQYGGTIVCQQCGCFFEHCECIIPALSSATGSISDILSVSFDDEEYYDSEEDLVGLGILPHSSVSDKLYEKIFEQRREKTEQNLKDMLFSWIVEGKYSLDTLSSNFISSCSQEIQYFLIVCRNLAEKWFKTNKKFLIEVCFPHELEGTKIGDYYSIVVRGDEVKKITNISFAIELLLRAGLVSTAYSLHNVDSIFNSLKFIVPCIGHYLITRTNIPSIVTRIYAEGMICAKVSKGLLDFIPREVLNWFFLVAFILRCAHNLPTQYQQDCHLFVCVLTVVLPLLNSYKNLCMYEAPRALSLLYKKEKENLPKDWTQLAPAALTLTTAYYSKKDIVDFYVDACEKWYMQPQSRLKPTVSEIKDRDLKHKFDDAWFKNCAEPFLDPLPTSTPRTPNEVRDAVEENVWMVENLSTNSRSNCFVICTGCVLIPFHYIPKEPSKFRFTRHNRGNKGNKSFEVHIEPGQCVRVKKYDLAMLWMPKTSDTRNLIDFFPLEFKETKDDRVGRIATRDINGNLEWDDVSELFYTRTAQSGMGYTFPGIFYIWKGAREGKCLSPIVTDDKQACISGLHIGGSTQCRSDGGFISFGVTPTRQDLLDTKAILEKFATVMPMSASGDFPMECMGIEILRREIKKKSCYLRMEENNSAYFYGSSMNCNRTPKSAVRDTPIKQSVKTLFNINEDWGSPKFKGLDGHSPHEPWETGMQKWIVDKPGLPFELLNRAKIDYTNILTRVIYGASEYWKSEIRILSWDETVNGIPGKRFIDSMNFKSSIGFPFKGSKKLFSENLGKIDGWQDKRVLDPIFIAEAEKIEELYRLGQRYYPWFTSTLKDEPTLSTKEKVRVFQATSTPFQLVMRKYTLGICRFLQMNPLDSECAVGIDPCSSEWNEMYDHLKGVQTPLYDRWFAIDYKAYDTSISSQMIVAIGRIFIDIAKVAGYKPEEITILNSIFTELSFSVVDFNGDVLKLDGANPSGNSLTVFINNLCNSLLMRIYFYHLYPKRKFSNSVRMMCYGDDLIAAVGAFAGSFTMKGYAAYMKQFGFTVTPAQKEEKLKNFSKLQEIDFLKRKFVWSSDYGSMIAPLEEMSIYKRLCNYMASDTAVEVIVGANIDGALDEWAFYGKTIYLDRQGKLIKIVEEFELHRFVHRLYLTYEQRVALWRQQNADPAVMGKGQSMDTSTSNCDSEGLGFFGWGNIIFKMGIGGPPQSHNSGSISSDDQMSINLRTTNTNILKSEVNTQNSLFVAEEPKTCEWVISPHSTSFSMEKEEVMTMVDGSSNQVVDIPGEMDETRFVSDASDNSVSGFLARPLKIWEANWSTATMFNLSLEPWALFLKNKRVVNRTATYKLFRGKMKVKVLINGNSFLFGRLMMSYWPLHDYDTMTQDFVDNSDLTQFSQMPRIFLDPTTSQGGEMTLPFFWHKDYVDLLSTDIEKMGALVFNELAPLKHCNGDTSITSRVTISVYAWIEDLELQGPTAAASPFIVPQSTPGIAPYAMGSKMQDSREIISQHINYLEPRGSSTIGLIDVPDSVNKLTFTSKQEVSLDPRILGLSNRDELCIRDIASRESYIYNFQWPLSAASETLLTNFRVSPTLNTTITVPASGSTPLHTAIRMPACCGAVLPFEYWNGTFKVRLQVVASAFHRGRLAVVYDPQGTPASRESNTSYTHIVDIASCRDVSFKVGPNQDKTMLKYLVPDGTNSTTDISSLPLSPAIYGNGTISVYVINELTVPNPSATTPSSIQINVFISVEDLDVFVPSGNFSSYCISPQSTGVDLVSSSEDLVDESQPYNEQALSLDQVIPVSNKRHIVYGGENITNFRTMLHRYYPWAALRLPSTLVSGNLKFFQLDHRMFPAYRGNVPGAVHLTGSVASPVGTNFFQMTLLNYLTPAFSGWRGSIRYKMFPRCTNLTRGMAYVCHQNDSRYATNIRDVAISPPWNDSVIARGFMFSGPYLSKSKGTVGSVKIVNPVIEYEIPWWEPIRFCPGKVKDWTSGSPLPQDSVDSGASVCIDLINNGADVAYDVHVSTGDDFNLYFFTGWPRMMYYLDAPPLQTP